MSNPRHAAPGRSFDDYADFYQNSDYNLFPQEHRASGSMSVRMMSVKQEPIDMIDVRTPDLVLAVTRSDIAEMAVDFGDGLHVDKSVRANSITITPPHSEGRFAVHNRHTVQTLIINGKLVSDMLDRHAIGSSVWEQYVGHVTFHQHVSDLIGSMWRCAAVDSLANDLFMDGLTLELLSALASNPTLSPMQNGRADTRVMRVIEYVEANLHGDISLLKLAAIAEMSAARLSRTFKATTGETVWAYIHRRRRERIT